MSDFHLMTIKTTIGLKEVQVIGPFAIDNVLDPDRLRASRKVYHAKSGRSVCHAYPPDMTRVMRFALTLANDIRVCWNFGNGPDESYTLPAYTGISHAEVIMEAKNRYGLE